MRKNNGYIKLPSIKSIEVSNYFLFSRNWSYELKDGLNLFLGANSIGKTTTAYMIIWGITGPWEDITKTYFTDREYSSLRQNRKKQIPTVKIKYNIDKTPIYVERRLDKPLILDFAIKGKHYYKNKVQNIENLYAKEITKLFGVENIEDIAFLLRKLLIREEEGNYLLWDKSDQSQVIRLLLNYSKFYREFRNIEKEVKDLDTDKRGTQDIQYQFKDRKKHLINQRDEDIARGKAIKSKKDLLDQINNTSQIISDLRKTKEKNLNDITYLKNVLNSFEKQINTLNFELDLANDEFIAIERSFFESVYTSPKVLLSAHKIENYNICMFCNNKITKKKADEITNTIEHFHNCPVCSSIISTTPPIPKVLQDQINQKLFERRDKISKANHELSLLNKKRSSAKSQLMALMSKQEDFDEKLNSNALILYDLKIKLSAFEKGDVDQFTPYDRDIKAIETQIEEYQAQINDIDKKYVKKLRELHLKNEELNKKIDVFSDELNQKFKKYSKFFNDDCKLVPHEGRKPRDSKIKLTTFCPYYNDKNRPYQSSVSKSEGIFLEYLFRMSLLELYSSKSSSSPFLILETSEGVFDIYRSKKLANAISYFGKNNFPFVTITNLSKPDFINEIVAKYKDGKKRILNFLEFGVLSKAHEKESNIEMDKLCIWNR